MKTESPLFRSIGVLLALLMFAALPSSVLATPCEPCCPCNPVCEFYYGNDGWRSNTLELETEYPTNSWIFYTKTLNTLNTNDPCHDANGTPCPSPPALYTTYKVANGAHIGLPQGTTYIRMVAWSSGWGDSEIVDCDQQNPPN